MVEYESCVFLAALPISPVSAINLKHIAYSLMMRLLVCLVLLFYFWVMMVAATTMMMVMTMLMQGDEVDTELYWILT